MIFPTTIHESNVLDGIAEPVAIVRNRLAQPDHPDRERTITFDTGPHLPPLIYFDPVVHRLREFRNNDLEYNFSLRARIVFRLPVLTATEAAKWRQLANDFIAGYDIYMRPHNDNTLQLEWQVIPTPNTVYHLGYVAEKYLLHTTEMSFTAKSTQRAMNLSSSAPTFRPVIYG